jgi:hypothetical protein
MSILELIATLAPSTLHPIKEGTIDRDMSIAPDVTRAEFYAIGKGLAAQGEQTVGIDRLVRIFWFPSALKTASCGCWYVANARGKPHALFTPLSLQPQARN